jgi:hypothetical protein
MLCELLPAAIEGIEDPVGTVAAAVGRSIDALAPVVAAAPTSATERDAWLERLWAALRADEAGHLRRLAEHWGALCVTPTRARCGRRGCCRRRARGWRAAASVACLASQVAAGDARGGAGAAGVAHDRGLARETVRGAGAGGERGGWTAALSYAQASNPLGHRHAQDIARVCEAVLLAAGQREAAYREYAVAAHWRQNCRQTFDALLRAYPEVGPSQLLEDLIAASPGQEGRWFATACALRFHGLAAEIAGRSPCDPRTLIRAGLQQLEGDPGFAGEVGLAALRWLCGGHGVEISGDDVYAAHDLARAAALRTGTQGALRAAVAALCDQPHPAAQWVHGLLARELAG